LTALGGMSERVTSGVRERREVQSMTPDSEDVTSFPLLGVRRGEE